jgi:hypothetical protein
MCPKRPKPDELQRVSQNGSEIIQPELIVALGAMRPISPKTDTIGQFPDNFTYSFPIRPSRKTHADLSSRICCETTATKIQTGLG